MKRKVTDLKPNEAILISNDSERDAILQLMEDAGMRWIDCNPTEYKPDFGYPFYLFTYDFDGENRLCTSRNSYDFITYPATDFIGSEGEMERGITIVKQNGEVISAETIATLRSEKAELIEALRAAKDELLLFYKKTGTPPRIELDAKIYNALTKYETK